jgi:surface adhesion protein
MPILIQTVNGNVVGLWGTAHVKLPNGQLKLLKVGDVVAKGDVILTTQNGIVEITPDLSPAAADTDRVIAELEQAKPEVAPAAGLAGGGDGGMTPGLRVGRITEGVSPAGLPLDYDSSRPADEPERNTAPETYSPTAEQSIALSASASSVSEGGSLIYTATLSEPVSGAPLVITLSNGQSITIAVGATTGSSAPVAVRPDDAYTQGNQTVVVGITGTTGGSAPGLNTSATVSTQVTDDLDATPLTLSASSNAVLEGGSVVYTATLAAPVTGSPLLITLSNGQTITIPVGSSSGSSAPFAVRPDDVYTQGSETLTVGVASTSGGNFEALAPAAPVSTTVSDTPNPSTVTLSASASNVAEGGSVVYTASVNNPVTGAPLVLTLSNGQTITIPVGASSGSSTPFAVRPDDVQVQGPQDLHVGITTATGGNFEAISPSFNTVTTTVNDDSDTSTLTLSASASSVVEGGSITYTASVSAPVAGTPLLITLSNGQVITIPVGASSGNSAPFAVRADDVQQQGSDTLTVGVASSGGGNFEALTPVAPVSTTVLDDTDVSTLGLTASSASVLEGGSVTYTATVGAPVEGSPLVLTLSNGQTITIPVGASSGSSAPFAVRADDAYLQGSRLASAAPAVATSRL